MVDLEAGLVSSTLKELSERLGVSPSTISRALSGHDVKRPATRARAERIRALAAEVGYTPNSLARSLKTKRRQLVGLILPDIMNDYYAVAATRVQETLAAEGLRVMLCVTHDDPVIEEAHLRVLQEERVAGIVVVPSPRAPRSGSPRPWHETRLAMPIVELVRHGTPPEADAVLIDDVDAGRQGARHLVGLGHRRIAVLSGPPTLNTSEQRLAGYRQALEEAAIPVDNSLICSVPYRREAARLATRHLLDGRAQPTALIAMSNELVVGALQALAERHVRVPDDLSLVGFGNPDWFALLRPALTTVALPIGEMATVAVQLLLKHIGTAHGAAADGNAPPIISHFQTHLIVRDSTRALSGL